MSNQRTVFCISFDGVPVSGIVEECIKLASVFQQRGFNVCLDLGYEIFPDSPFFGSPEEAVNQLPAWVEPISVDAPDHVSGYDQLFVQRVLTELVRGDGYSHMLHRCVRNMAEKLSDHLLQLWRSRDVRYVVVENGTLPENLIFTHALRRAIVLYGLERGYDRYVIWRDHDLMWYRQRGRYGDEPYLAVPRPLGSPYIVHVVTNDLVREKFEAWGRYPIEVMPSYHDFLDRRKYAPLDRPLRHHYGIPVDACLIARCSRVVPEKRIDREIDTIAALRRIAESKGCRKEFYLFVTGPLSESPQEVARLKALARSHEVEDRVIWGDGLASFRKHGADERAAAGGTFSVRDLLFEADLSSFLTSFGYEGYGLPPSEAIATGLPFTCSTYEVYDAVYGENRYKAPLYRINMGDDNAMPGPDYHATLFDFLLDGKRQAEYAESNFRRGRTDFSLEAMESRVLKLLPSLRKLPS